MLDKIEDIKKQLNEAIEEKGLGDNEVLRISMELDQLILDYYKEKEGDRE